MTVGRICCREVHLAEPRESVLVVAGRMRENNLGTLLVLDDGRRPIGILTDRDLVLRVLATGKSPAETLVEQVMTHHPRTVVEATPIEDALTAMRDIGVRRMPVVGSRGELIGIVSVDDVLELLVGELGDIGRVLAKSGRGIVPPVTRVQPARKRRPSTEGLERSRGEVEC